MNLYLDSSIVIYLIEQTSGLGLIANRAIHRLNPMAYSCTELTRFESMIVPRRNGNAQLEMEFEWFFRQSFVRLQSFNRSVFDRAIDLRAKYRSLRTPDSLHIASAIESSCDGFLTGDARLAAISEIAIHVI
jgi:uncharacterized protein